MKTSKRFLICAFTFAALVFSLQAQKYTPDQERGFDAYRKSDWTSAMFFLRKAGSSSAGYDAETLYMLVMSEMNAGEYSSAVTDSSLFVQKFAKSHYAPYMLFQKGRALHFLGRNEDAVLVLSDFCHQNQDSELYASALYWIAECFYAEYNFDSARSLYERIVIDFPSDSKVTDSRYRIEMINQREREEKLVYLLKVTGEENLAAREDYERQIKLYQTEDKLGLRRNLTDARKRIEDLESQLAAEKRLNSELSATNAALESSRTSVLPPQSVPSPEVHAEQNTQTSKQGAAQSASQPSVNMNDFPLDDVYDPEVAALKRKAYFLQYLLNEQQRQEKKNDKN